MANQKPVLEIRDGNAFAILGCARKAARRAGWSQGQIKKVTDEMTSGDYDNLRFVAAKYFEIE